MKIFLFRFHFPVQAQIQTDSILGGFFLFFFLIGLFKAQSRTNSNEPNRIWIDFELLFCVNGTILFGLELPILGYFFKKRNIYALDYPFKHIFFVCVFVHFISTQRSSRFIKLLKVISRRKVRNCFIFK